MLDVMDSPLHGVRAAKPSAKFELLRIRDFRPITFASSLLFSALHGLAR